jgi:hypothetical protein
MAKRNKGRRGSPGGRSGRPNTPARPRPAAPGAARVEIPSLPDDIDPDLLTAATTAAEAEQETVASSGDHQHGNLTDAELRSISVRARTWAQLNARLQTLKVDLDSRQLDLDHTGSELDRRENDLHRRETDAAGGFADLLESEKRRLAAEIAIEKAAILETARAESVQLRAQLDEDTAQIQADRDQLRRQQRELAEREDLAEEQQRLVARQASRIAFDIEAATEQARAAVATELTETQRSMLQLNQELSNAHDQLAIARPAAEDAAGLRLQLGGYEPTELLEELARLRREDSRGDAAPALTAAERARLIELEHAVTGSAEREADLLVLISELRTQLTAREADLASMTVADDARLTYQQVIENYRHLLDQERAHLDALRQSPSGAPFPQCSMIDDSDEYQLEPSLTTAKSFSLAKFVDGLQIQLRDAFRDRPLHYDIHDLQLEIAGMAASRLHILQGPSGTGKTSLPTAMATALRWGHRVVSVQAGWRDRQDLLGYYNAFEQRYQETEFFRAIYEAGTPRYRGLPYLVVLDEANLSYVEQYFADYLSLLELAPEDRQSIPVAPRPVPGAARHLVDGYRLALPENVWFIATANQDETTMGFAPKTIDRAHVLELARGEKATGTSGRVAKAAVTLKDLQKAFAAAQQEHADLADSAVDQLANSFRPTLAPLRIGYANRLESQLRDFVPVAIACGGSAGAAADHLLATKVVYRLQNRFDLERSAVQHATTALEKAWTRLFPGTSPDKCLELLDAASRTASA